MPIPARAPRLALIASALLLATAAACRDVTVPLEDPASLTFAPALQVNLDSGWTRTASGLYYRDVVVGSGAVVDSGWTVNTRYTGWLANGRQFDTNREARNPLSFVLGTRQVIRGWDEGIEGMRVNSRRRLVVPPSLGYGARTNGDIPAGSVLVFDIDLVGATAPTTTTPSTSTTGTPSAR